MNLNLASAEVFGTAKIQIMFINGLNRVATHSGKKKLAWVTKT